MVCLLILFYFSKMKCSCLLLLLMLFAKLSFGQSDTLYQYLDYNEHICKDLDTFYIRMAVKKPGLWLVKEYYASEGTLKMAGLFSDDSFKTGQGVFRYYYKNGGLEKEGHFADGKKHGLWMSYDEKGNTADSSLFDYGMPELFSYHWHNGLVSFKGIYDSIGKGSGEEWEYYDDNTISSYGKYSKGYKYDSIWTYYFHNGIISTIEHYNKGVLLNRECYNRKGKLPDGNCDGITKTISANSIVTYLDHNVQYPKEWTGIKAAHELILDLLISEMGKVENIDLIQESISMLDKQVIKLILEGPRWEPAFFHNRPIKSHFKFRYNYVIY